MSARVEGWESRLAAVVEAHRGEPFAWGRNDCVTFAADAVEAVMGVRPAVASHGAATADEADEAIAAATPARTLAAAVSLVLGNPIRVADAFRGDVAIGRWGEGLGALGVVLGSKIAAPGPFGLVFSPREKARFAWKVGGR